MTLYQINEVLSQVFDPLKSALRIELVAKGAVPSRVLRQPNEVLSGSFDAATQSLRLESA